ncbi:methylated-DNA--[protein]-cysteine S-methyltransferase [Halovenus sp. WSH3]|uniref:Methylated-DNA--[protein]-cysteine S-methyltransferase n=1 Tax=Halovenus carboxidivorans TaxID=2692199 RepID=A0A6B0T4T4_9EURY|nr:MGMT family protein [Halovenus carboxidivorans]MXR53145.1 methylated-DNA--[protein]-cysteine S-methyltransferase [Halovenus carboxidivorans]
MEDAGIYARESSFLDRYVEIGVAQSRVLSVEFPHEPNAKADSEHELLDRIDAYLQGEEDDFADVNVALTMATDDREVLEKVREIPYGDSGTVRQVTMMVPGRSDEDEDDLAAVRDALRANPAPIFIPTHRVSDGPSGMPSDVASKLRALEGI